MSKFPSSYFFGKSVTVVTIQSCNFVVMHKSGFSYNVISLHAIEFARTSVKYTPASLCQNGCCWVEAWVIATEGQWRCDPFRVNP